MTTGVIMGLPGWNVRRDWLRLGALVCWCGVVAASGAEPVGASDLPLQPPGVGLSIVRLLGAFALVISIALGGVWLFRNWGRFARRPGTDRVLKVLEVRMLGARQSLLVVGYEDQRLLLASSPSGIAFLCRLPAAESAAQTADPPGLAPTFMDALHLAVGRRG